MPGPGGAPLLVTIFALALAACASPASVMPPLSPADREPDPINSGSLASFRPRISKLAFHGGELWMRLAGGTLLAANLETRRVQRRLAREHVVDLHRTLDDRLWVLGIDADTDDLHVWQRRAGGWEPLLELSAPGSRLLALTDLRGKPLVLAERALFWVEDRTLKSIALDAPVRRGRAELRRAEATPAGSVHVAATDAGTLYVGTDSGKYGGELARITLATGRVELVRRGAPITGVVPDPGSASCVIAGLGRTPARQRGRLLRACGLDVSEIPGPWQDAPYPPSMSAPVALAEAFAPLWPVLDQPIYDSDDLRDICAIDPLACRPIAVGAHPLELFALDAGNKGTTGIFGLARSQHGVWVVSYDALYHHGPGGTVAHELPAYDPFGPTFLASVPGAFALATSIGIVDCLTGWTPLVAAGDLEHQPKRSRVSEPARFGSCYRVEDTDVRLCLEHDRYFWRDERGWTSASLVWSSLPDGTVRALRATGEEVRLRFEPTRALAFTAGAGSFRAATLLLPVTGADLDALQHEIAELAPVELVCAQAHKCADAVSAAGLSGSRDVPADLRNCTRSLGKRLSDVRQAAERVAAGDARLERALAVCSVK